MEIFPVDLPKFHISHSFGFLLETPLDFLPEYFEKWNFVAKNMPSLVAAKKIREEVKQMELLDYSKLCGHREYRLAHLQLSIIAAGYIWQEGDDGAAKVLPSVISIPWCGVSKHLGLQPVMSHASLVLANWKYQNHSQEIDCLYQLPGGTEGEWFITVTAQVEMAFAQGLKNILDLLFHAQNDNVIVLTECLLRLIQTLGDMKLAFSKMHDKLSAMTFYSVMRPFLTGWGDEGSPLPDGIIYEGVDEKPVKMTGGSAAQSSTWQTIDAVLGIQHKPEIDEFLKNMHHYMPPPHREFIVTIETHAKVKYTVEKHTCCEKLRTAYNQCVQAVVDFRSYHIQVVTKTCFGVIYIPKKAKNIKTSKNFMDVNATIDTMKADIEVLKKCKKSDLERLTAQHAQIQASIQNIRDHINKHLDDLETAARKELERKFKVQEDEIKNTLGKLQDQLSEIEKAASKLKDSQNESQVFVDLKEAKTKQSEGRKLLNDVEESVGKPAVRFVPNDEIFNILEHKSFGTFEAQKSVASVSHHGDFNVKTPGDDATCWITGSCQMLDGNFVIIDFCNRKIKLLDRSYKVNAEFVLFGPPKNVCRTSPTEVAIAMYSDKKVQFAEVTDKISLKGSFWVGYSCRGIAYNKGLLYVSCGGSKKKEEGPGQVQVYDISGKLLQTFMRDKHNTDLFSVPEFIAVSECRTKIHISDQNHGIVNMNLDGTGPWKFKNPDMKGIAGVCMVNNDDFIVLGIFFNNMILIDKNGQQKAILLKETDGIKKPWTVLHDRPNSRLIVSMLKSNHIKVYNLL